MTLTERWKTMSFNDRLRAIASEVGRAEIWESKDQEIYKSAIERGLELTELSLDNPTSKEEIYPMLVIKEQLAEFYVGRKNGIQTLSNSF